MGLKTANLFPIFSISYEKSNLISMSSTVPKKLSSLCETIFGISCLLSLQSSTLKRNSTYQSIEIKRELYETFINFFPIVFENLWNIFLDLPNTCCLFGFKIEQVDRLDQIRNNQLCRYVQQLVDRQNVSRKSDPSFYSNSRFTCKVVLLIYRNRRV
jgi:hypothetical protein